MKIECEKTNKRFYSTPTVVSIILDNEIALILESNPPDGPFEGQVLNSPEFHNTDPFITKLG